MRCRIECSLSERQGGVSTYVRALRTHLPREGVEIVDGDDFDVMLHVGPHEYGALPCKGGRSVAVVHDLIPETLLGDERVRVERARVLSFADAVIAVSHETKSAIVREYGVDPAKIRVVYHGAPESGHDAATPEGRAHVKPYLLYVGKRNEYKRFRWMLRSLASMFWTRPGLRLLCTGEPFCRREKALILLLGLWGRLNVRRVPDAEMRNVYSNACALVYPSCSEGFGLPVVEAMACGCPVVLCHASCLPEIAGDAAAYFDDGDGKGLRRIVARLLRRDPESVAMRTALVEKGLSRARDFSWRKCACETAAVLREVCGR